MDPQDIDLIRSAQAGDAAAFAELYDRYVRKVHDFAYFRTFDRELAEDITSDTFLRALKNLPKFDLSEGASFSGWLYAIARNAITDQYRKGKRLSPLEDMDEMPDHDPIDEDAQRGMDLSRVRAALSKLSPEQRDVVVMRVWDELSYREIAEATGRSEAACKMAFSRALGKLKASLTAISLLIALIPFSL